MHQGRQALKREEKNALTRQRIVDAAMEEFAHKGYERASLNEACAGRGFSKGIIYHYFRDKDELYLLCVQLCFDEMTAALQQAAQTLQGPAGAQLQAYFDGTLTAFDLPLNPQGIPFRRRVWAALQEIPYGETRSYGQLAAALGCPGAARAVGGANHHNPISIIIPCHRVIGADGSLTGYGGGLDMKDWLLRHERRHSHA